MAAEGTKELKALGNAIREGRKALGVSQEDFAELCDVHRTYIGQLERGEKNVSFVSLLRIVKALKTKPSRLFEHAGL